MENNFTQVPNGILESLCAAKLNGSQLSIALFIIRKTYGYQKEEDRISVFDIYNSIKINRRTVQREIANLVKRNIINVKNQYINCIKINPDFDTWVAVDTPPRAVNTPLAKSSDNLAVNTPPVAVNTPPKLAVNRPPTKEINKYISLRDNKGVSKDTHVKNLIKYFSDLYLQTFAKPYVAIWGRDGAVIKRILSGLNMNGSGPGYVAEMMRLFLSPHNQFKGNCDIPSFGKAINRMSAMQANDPLRVNV